MKISANRPGTILAATVALTLVIIYFCEQYTYHSIYERVSVYGSIISDDIWNMNKSSTSVRLGEIAQVEHLSNAEILHNNGSLFLSYKSTPIPMPWLDRKLMSIGLINLRTVTAPVMREGKKIGYLRIFKLNRNFYLYFYISVLLTIAGFAIFNYADLVRSRRELRQKNRMLNLEIEEKKQAESALRGSEQKYRSLVENIPLGVSLINREMEIIASNGKMMEWFPALAREENCRCFDIFNGEPRTEPCENCPGLITLKTGEIKDQVRTIKINSEKRHFRVWTSPIFDEKGEKPAFINITEDITKTYRLEEQLNQSKKLQAIGELAGGVAHDFNNRLVGIMGFATLLRDDMADPKQRDCAQRIINASKRAADLTRQLLAFARKGNYSNIGVNVDAIVKEVIMFVEHSFDKRITIRYELETKTPYTIGDPTQIQNAIFNLAINARDAMPSGGELLFRIGGHLVSKPEDEDVSPPPQPGEYVTVMVSDSGSGMDQNVVSHIFEPFFTTKKIGEGTGMGLAAVYGTVQNHHGFIKVESAPAKGSSFTIFLPMNREYSEPSEKETQHQPARRANIMIIDDEEDVRDVTEKMLQGLGHHVVSYTSGPEALDFYKNNWKDIDIVFMDLVMPFMSGYDLFLGLKKINPGVKVITVSGYSINAHAHKLIKHGAVGFIQKPFSSMDLNSELGKALSGSFKG